MGMEEKKKHGGKSEFQGPGEGSRAMRSMQDTVRWRTHTQNDTIY